jgi:glycosyltransferase involved in cell wall biosynthesis
MASPDSHSLLPITLVVMTRNEAANIARCLDSVPFVSEKLVVDCGSSDDTVAIAREHGARVVHQDWLGFGPQRNFASTQASHDWILVLDADEFLSRGLVEECRRRLGGLISTNLACITLRRSTWYMGAPMRWYRPMVGERSDRIYHRGRARWTDARVHESLRFNGAAAQLKAPFNHLHNPSLVHKQLKVLLYSELKARDWLEQGRATRMWQTPLVFIAAFLKDYLLRLACLDGWRGFIVAQVAADYAVYKRLRYYEMRRNPGSVDAARQQLSKHQLEQ